MQDHLDRFYTSAKALDIHIPMPKEELGKLLTDLLAKVDGTTHFVYWQVTRGVETRNHVYAEDLPGKLWVSIRPEPPERSRCAHQAGHRRRHPFLSLQHQNAEPAAQRRWPPSTPSASAYRRPCSIVATS